MSSMMVYGSSALAVAGGGLVLLLAVVLGLVAAAVGFLAAAVATVSVALMCLSGLGLCAGVAFALGALGGRLIQRRRWRAVAVGTALVTCLLAAIAARLTVFEPLVPPDQVRVLSAPPETRFWELPTGSRIAYRKLAARPSPTAAPVIYLHGGPGAGVVAVPAVSAALAFLTDQGRDLYLYDQIGGGLSGRLSDVSAYTRERHLADLEAIRLQIGVETVLLMGESWGAQLATHYLVAHPARVEQLVLISPGPVHPDLWKDSNPCDLVSRASAEVQERFGRLLGPRIVAALLLLEVNPRAAPAFLPDAEADAFVRREFTPLIDGMVCDPSKLPDHGGFGLGLWANLVTDEDIKNRHDRISSTLASLDTPTLVLRGECDYCLREVAEEYDRLLPNSRLMHLKGAGHLMWLDRPAAFADSVRAFLVRPGAAANLDRGAAKIASAAEPF